MHSDGPLFSLTAWVGTQAITVQSHLRSTYQGKTRFNLSHLAVTHREREIGIKLLITEAVLISIISRLTSMMMQYYGITLWDQFEGCTVSWAIERYAVCGQFCCVDVANFQNAQIFGHLGWHE